MKVLMKKKEDIEVLSPDDIDDVELFDDILGYSGQCWCNWSTTRYLVNVGGGDITKEYKERGFKDSV